MRSKRALTREHRLGSGADHCPTWRLHTRVAASSPSRARFWGTIRSHADNRRPIFRKRHTQQELPRSAPGYARGTFPIHSGPIFGFVKKCSKLRDGSEALGASLSTTSAKFRPGTMARSEIRRFSNASLLPNR